MNRRSFLQNAVAGALASAATSSQAAPPAKKMIGMQVGAVSFVDEGISKVLDILQETAAVNTLFLATFTYGRGIAGRQVPGQPLPDHGKQEYDTGYFQGGNYAKVRPQYYKDTGDPAVARAGPWQLDIIAEVLPEARKRGMSTICWTEDVWRDDVPDIEKLQEMDLYGRKHDAVRQQSVLSQFPARGGGRLHALVRHRRDHVGFGTPGGLGQCVGREARRPRRADTASASSAKKAKAAASIQRASQTGL